MSDLPSARQRATRRPAAGSLAVFALVVYLAAAIAGAGAYFFPVLRLLAGQTGQGAAQATPTPTANEVAPPAGGMAPFTVLLLGSDDDAKFQADRVLTQSMILVRVNPASREVTMLSIPRDLWVPLSTGGTAKIDAAYALGGPKAAIETVQNNFGVHIDHYAWIGLKGLIALIDRFGGVDVVTSNPVLDDFYPNDLDTANPYGFTRVAVLPGPQHLDGLHALQYVRSRHDDVRGDFGRSVRQQQVLIALRARANRINPADLPDLAAAFNGEFKTSMSPTQLAQLLPLARGIDVSSIHQVVLLPPYTGTASIQGQDVVLPNWQLIRPLVRQTFP